MAVFETWIESDLQKMIVPKALPGNAFCMDSGANLIGVSVMDGGEPATLSGTVAGKVVRSDGTTVPVTGGTLSGNRASIVLPQRAYEVPGPIAIAVTLTSGSTVTTIGAVTGYVVRSQTDSIIDPGTILPTIDTLINQIQTAIDSIPADYSQVIHSIAPSFSSSTAYSAGDMVWYPGEATNPGALYQFTSAHAAGEWTGTDATAVVFANELSSLKSALGVNILPWTTGGYINCTVTTLPSVASSSAFSYIKVACQAGDAFTLSMQSITNRGSFAFWDSSGNRLYAHSNAKENGFYIIAPYNSAWLTVNTSDTSKLCYKGVSTADKFTYLDKEVKDITGLKQIKYSNGAYIQIASGTMNPVWANANYRYALIPCVAGDAFTINGGAGNTAKLYGFYDSSFTNLVVGTTTSADDLVIVAPTNAAWLVLNDNVKTKESYYGKATNQGESGIENYAVYTDTSASLSQNTSVARVDNIADTMNGYTLTARFDITSNVNFRFGLNNGADPYSSGYVIVDDTNVEVNYVTDTETLAHGLTFSTFVQISIEVSDNARKAQLVITTLGGQFVHEIPWRASCGRLQLTNLSATAITNVETNYYCSSVNKDVWAFGDSYFNICAPMMGELRYTNLMMDAKSGRKSADAITSLNKCLAVRNPKVIYWAMGMNDGDSGAVNANWKSALDTVIAYCSLYDIELILATIPNTPTVDNTYKNAVVKASGYEYVDVCHAVGADISTSWFAGLLRADKVHPTEQGVNVIVQEWVSIMPFIKD